MPREPETFRTLYCDPGEDFGWVIGRDTKLLAGGTEKMWSMSDAIEDAIDNPDDPSQYLNSPVVVREGVDPEENLGPIERVVCEDFRIYPWKSKALHWDPVRTARVIGAVTHICRRRGIPLIFQGANIKKTAVAAGAEELFWKPLRENRHQNDALMHMQAWIALELLTEEYADSL